MQKETYTGINDEEIKRLCGDKVLAPYFCMGFSIVYNYTSFYMFITKQSPIASHLGVVSMIDARV